MAPSANRRPGHSRRAQYSTFFGYLAGLGGLGLGGALLIVSILHPQFLSGLRGVAADVAEPPGTAAAHGRDFGHDTVSTIRGYIEAAGSYARLERELNEAKVRLVEAEAVAEENRRLKRLLGLAHNDPGAVAVTRITSSTATSTRRLATIGAGKGDGVAPGMPVRSVRGLVGRVLQVSERSASVLLVTDTESLVPVRRARDGLPAFAQGRGDGTVQIRLINLGINPLKEGDVFVTSGSGGLYRPGTAIAVARQLLNDGAVASVLSDPAATEYVIVEPVWAPEAAAWSEGKSRRTGE
jgi:rod shape-determining protein MreC